MQGQFALKLTTRAMREVDGSLRSRAYTANDVDMWAQEAIGAMAERLAAGEMPRQMFLFLYLQPTKNPVTMFAVGDLGPILKEAKSDDVAAMLAGTMRSMRAFAMVRFDFAEDLQTVDVAFETLSGAWTRKYVMNGRKLGAIATEVAAPVSSRNGFAGLLFDRNLN